MYARRAAPVLLTALCLTAVSAPLLSTRATAAPLIRGASVDKTWQRAGCVSNADCTYLGQPDAVICGCSLGDHPPPCAFNEPLVCCLTGRHLATTPRCNATADCCGAKWCDGTTGRCYGP